MALGLFLIPAIANAGPPYITDDPEPTDTGHWEIYNYVQGTQALDSVSGQAGFDINYGAYKDLQLTAVLPVDFERVSALRLGAGNVELAAKYRFLHQSDDAFIPDVAFFPRVFLPLANHAFGTGRTSLFLPLWAQKDFGKWFIFGGGGFTLNPGTGQRNFWLNSVAAQYALSDALSLGAEVFHQTPNAIDAKPYTGINLGMTYRLTKHWSLLASAGPGVQHAREGGRFNFYLALKADY